MTGGRMDLSFLSDDETRDVLGVMANAFVDRVMVEERKTATEAFIVVAEAVNVGRALARERANVVRLPVRLRTVEPA